MMKKNLLALLVAVAFAAWTLPMTGCEQQTETEKAAEEVQDAADDAAEAVEEAADDAADAVEDATEN